MREDWIEAIKTIVDENRIRLQEPMSRHTTFRIGGILYPSYYMTTAVPLHVTINIDPLAPTVS